MVTLGVAVTLGVGDAATGEFPVDVGLAVGVGVAAGTACAKLVPSGNNAVATTVPKIRVLFQKNRLAFNTYLSLDKPRKENCVLSRHERKAAAAESAKTGQMTHRQILMVLIGLMSGMFLSSLDQSIVGSAMRTIADDLQGLELQAWATTAYLITSTISTPIYGKLGDIFGHRRLFLTAISIFIVGSLGAGMATSMFDLAAWRAIQGVGAKVQR